MRQIEFYYIPELGKVFREWVYIHDPDWCGEYLDIVDMFNHRVMEPIWATFINYVRDFDLEYNRQSQIAILEYMSISFEESYDDFAMNIVELLIILWTSSNVPYNSEVVIHDPIRNMIKVSYNPNVKIRSNDDYVRPYRETRLFRDIFTSNSGGRFH